VLKLTAQDFHRRYAPTECDLRIFLRERGVEESPPSEFEQVLMRLGQRYEAKHLATFPEAIDLRSFESDKRFEQTVTLVKNGCPVLYQPVLKVQTTLDGAECEFVGEPDFLLRESSGYVIRDVKMARHVDDDHHPEIVFQLQFYGWLYDQVFGLSPIRLEALNGKGDIIPIPANHQAVLTELRTLIRLKRLSQEPYEPVGWSKCVGCGFRDHCWPKAVAAKDVALVYEIDQSLAAELHERGAASIPQLVEHFNADSLSELKRPWGKKFQKVGKRADMILQRARVMLSGREVVLHPPIIPHHEHYVMFDLEGMPPHLDELDKIYLWGTQVFGKTQGKFMPAVSGFGDDGDRDGWKQFLTNAQSIFQQFGDIPFIHWHHYEKTHLNDYVERYGDPEGVAARVRRNLLDLLPIARDSVLLPLSSYSLKEVEKYVGFKRSQTEYGGSWSIAKYIEATESHDENSRNKLVGEILTYNQEDLAATWAVFEWLRNKSIT
jgi:uncharacterized protein